ncbi:MAG: nuclear transport factor 2 family protein [Flavobacteriales bacterium]|nr:MAG: nuclear transport factor 2 family protein [Flavobacteriales bacterium]
MNKIYLSILALAIGTNVYAQKSDGTVKSLVATEKAFAQKVAKDGANAAFTAFAAPDAIVFRPNPINAKKYFATATDTKDLTWEPNYARLSKSRDWGFTSGSFVAGSDKKTYGHYLSVWRGKDGNWEYIIDLGAEAMKPIKSKDAKNLFIEPVGTHSPKFASAKDLKTATDIIYSTEKTLNTMLKTHGVQAFSGFINPDARLLFPGTDAIMGKDAILAFNNRVIDKINLKTTQADKALGGDFAYTYGLATIDYKADLRESFNYVFIWERQADATWNIIAQLFTVAER